MTRPICASSRENRSLGFPTKSKTNMAVQPQKMAKLEIFDLGSRGIVLTM